MGVHCFGLINKATWPESFTFGIKINCHGYLKILGLPASMLFTKNLQVESIKPKLTPTMTRTKCQNNLTIVNSSLEEKLPVY